MANQNQKNNGTTEQVVNEQPVQQNVVPEQPAPVAQQVAQVEPQKEGFGAWCKRHWKGLVAGVTGTGAVVTSAIFAYKKGKAAGVASVPMPQVEPEDYSLNPNE